jgi:two-component system sensor histidine kinase CreC
MLVLSELEGMDRLARREAVDLPALVREVLSEYQAFAQAREVTMEMAADSVPEVVGDPSLLRTAFGNILQNAIEFSPQGGTISLGVERREGCVRWVVSDQGPGVPEYARDRVFERLFSLPRPDGGRKSSGLGLSLAGEIAELHGARIELDCPKSGGTRIVWIFNGSFT